MANALGIVNVGSLAGRGIREFLMERELQRRQLEQEANIQKRLEMDQERLRLEEARSTRADEQEARLAKAAIDAARLVREQFEYGQAKDTATMAGGDEMLTPGSEQTTKMERFFPNRLEQRPGIIDTPPVSQEGLVPGLNAPVPPGILDMGKSQIHEPGTYLKPGLQYEQARTAAQERAELAQAAAEDKATLVRIAVAEKARADAEKRNDKAETDQRAADLRRELAQLSANTQLTIAGGNQAIRRDTAETKAADTQAVKDRAAEAATAQATEIVSLVDEMLDDKGELASDFQTVVGGRRVYGPVSSFTGYGATASGKLKRLQDMLTLDKITSMSAASKSGSTGLSPMSDSDREMLSNAQSTLSNRAQDESSYATELKRIRDAAKKLIKPSGTTPATGTTVVRDASGRLMLK